MTHPDETGRPDRPDVEGAMAADALPDEVRLHGDTDETDRVQTERGPVEAERSELGRAEGSEGSGGAETSKGPESSADSGGDGDR